MDGFWARQARFGQCDIISEYPALKFNTAIKFILIEEVVGDVGECADFTVVVQCGCGPEMDTYIVHGTTDSILHYVKGSLRTYRR